MEAVVAAQYKLGKQLGSGAFGIIYEGTCIATDRKVAIKMVGTRSLIVKGNTGSEAEPPGRVLDLVTSAGRV
jgi:serine/threonine protein kinase